MIKCNNWPISVCSWSLGNDFDRIGQLREQTGVDMVNLALLPALDSGGDKYLSRIEKEQWNISATMINFPQEDYSTLESIKVTGGIVPEQYWVENKKRILDAMDVTVELGVEFLLLHFGFLSHSDKDAFASFKDKVQILAEQAENKGIMLLMETGQESAAELGEFLQQLDSPAIGVNFDPANMILYDKDEPLEAVRELSGWIKHIHIKDAVRTQSPGQWGSEVVWGSGQVGGDEFLRVLEEINFEGALAIEREAGENRIGDIKTAVELLKKF